MKLSIPDLRRIIRSVIAEALTPRAQEASPDLRDLPKDYALCGTCGYDHGYDFPLLSKEDLLTAISAHNLLGEKPPY